MGLQMFTDVTLLELQMMSCALDCCSLTPENGVSTGSQQSCCIDGALPTLIGIEYKEYYVVQMSLNLALLLVGQ